MVFNLVKVVGLPHRCPCLQFRDFSATSFEEVGHECMLSLQATGASEIYKRVIQMIQETTPVAFVSTMG